MCVGVGVCVQASVCIVCEFCYVRRVVIISGNDIGDEGVMALTPVLTNLKQLTSLDLSSEFYWGSTVLIAGMHISHLCWYICYVCWCGRICSQARVPFVSFVICVASS